MAGLFKSFVGGIFNAAAANIKPYKVNFTNQENVKGLTIVREEEFLYLYRRPGCFECVLMGKGITNKSYSLFRLTKESEAKSVFNRYCSILLPLVVSSSSVFQEEILQKISDTIREYSNWNVAHVAAFVGLFEAFRHPSISKCINSTSTDDKTSPLGAAIYGLQVQCVQELMKCDFKLNTCDVKGNTAYHLAVQHLSTVIPILMRYDKDEVIQWVNGKGETALYLSCKLNLTDATEMLLQAGCDPNITSTDALPIHIAILQNSLKSAELILKEHPDQISAVDHKYGATALHWVQTKEAVEMLAKFGCNMNAVSKYGDTALHVIVKKKLIDIVMSLLCHGTDCNILDRNQETPLHWAVLNDDVNFVQVFVVFGANLNQKNKDQHSPRHLAATSKGKNRELILYLLHVAGAKRCSEDIKGCLQGCVAEGSHNGVATETMKGLLKLDSVALFDDLMTAHVACDATMTHKEGSVLDMVAAPVNAGDTVLCLDGGGIRGLVLLQVLMDIEQAIGKPIHQCFDWIGGTNTGAILALGIAKGVSLQYIKGLYFRLKDEVLVGRRPYSSTAFENLLKKEFGESAVMSELKYAKVMVTAVKTDTYPAKFYLFRNYVNPFKVPHTHDPPAEEEQDPPEEQLIWKAARSSGAAPSYFRCMGCFVDGGLMANNPTLDVLTEINEYNQGLRMQNKHDEVRHIGCVLSIGTGRVPELVVKNCDVFFPDGLFDAVNSVMGLTALGKLLVDQATLAEGRPVDRARAWCNMINVPYFRFSPRISEDVPLDCSDNKTLINMMWETTCYMVANRQRVLDVAALLSGDQTTSKTEKE